jgi:dihydrofolate reductase
MSDERAGARVIVQQWISLDGRAAGPTDEMDVMHVVDEQADQRSQAYNLQVLEDTAVVLLGRRTYEKFVGYWPTATEAIAPRVNGIPKVIASRSMDPAPWGDHAPATITDDAVAFVEEFRTRTLGTLVVWGSLDLCASLLAAGQVDELDLFIAPVWVGEGVPLLSSASAVRLEQLASEDWGTITHARYRVVR